MATSCSLFSFPFHILLPLFPVTYPCCIRAHAKALLIVAAESMSSTATPPSTQDAAGDKECEAGGSSSTEAPDGATTPPSNEELSAQSTRLKAERRAANRRNAEMCSNPPAPASRASYSIQSIILEEPEGVHTRGPISFAGARSARTSCRDIARQLSKQLFHEYA